MSDTGIIVLESGDRRYTFQLRLGLVNRVGVGTPKEYLGKEFKTLIPILKRKGFDVTRILI